MRRTRFLLIFLVVLVATMPATAPFAADGEPPLTKGRHGPIDPPPFDIAVFEPQDWSEELPCGEILSEERAFPAYMRVQSALRASTPATDIPYLSCFLPEGTQTPDAGPVLRDFLTNAFYPDVLYGYLAKQYEATLRTTVETGEVMHWRAGRLGHAALIAFKRTGDTRFIELFQSYFDRVMMLRDSQLGFVDDYHGKVMDAWGVRSLGEDTGISNMWVAHVTRFAVVMLPATGFAREIAGNPDLAQYRAWADGVTAFFERAYPQFDVDLRSVPGTNVVWYWRPLDDMYEPTNHVHVLGRALLNMYAITDDPLYAERIRTILSVFEDGVRIDEEGLASWNYSPYFQVQSARMSGRSRPYSEHSVKGANTVPFLYEAAADGFQIDPSVLEAVTASIRDFIVADGSYKLHTHPLNSRPIQKRDLKKSPGLGSSISGYQFAGVAHPEIEKMIVDIVAGNPAMYRKGWFSHYSLVPSYAMLLGRNP